MKRCQAYRSTEFDELWLPCRLPTVAGKIFCKEHEDAAISISLYLLEHYPGSDYLFLWLSQGGPTSGKPRRGELGAAAWC
jgi:hypothetical protein